MKDAKRRQFLKFGALAAAVSWSALPARAAGATHSALRGATAPERALAFYNTHTGESLRTIYWAEGGYLRQALLDINHVLRDHRTNAVKEMSPALLDFLYSINNAVDASQPFHIISGYRSPDTNAMLAARSGGVARHSMHLDGKAIDIRIPGRDLSQIRRAALILQSGGVGYYPDSDFVHMDVGRVRQWQG